MIQLELTDTKVKEKLEWQIKAQWIGRSRITAPTQLVISIGSQPPKSFSKMMCRQALNQLIRPCEAIDIKMIDIYLNLLENCVVNNKNQFYKTVIEKFYSEKMFIKLSLLPDSHAESLFRAT